MAARAALPMLAALLLAGTASAQAPADAIRIGVLNDMSGVYADDQGPGSLLAAQMAAEDYCGTAAGREVEVISGDHQNKAETRASIARRSAQNEGIARGRDLTTS